MDILNKNPEAESTSAEKRANIEPGVKSILHTLFVLGRISNLPTVWSNCVAGWLLAGGGSLRTLLNLCFGVSCLYVGGMFMNDACDVDYDKIYRPERPIPSGKIQARTVWLIAVTLIIIGAVSIFHISDSTAFLTSVLIGLILVYNAAHKKISFSPMLIGLCRLLLYLLGASAAVDTFNGLALWSGLVLALYVVGLSYIAKYESSENYLFSRSIIILLFCPIGLSIIVNDAGYRARGIIISATLVIWLIESLRHLNRGNSNELIMNTVSKLLAGIVLVDLVAVAGTPTYIAHYLVAFPILFILTLLLQKFVPAT
ncbi:MAG: UbiA family prenyltransferase [Verrucomicrobiia bacterium]